jgi:hypothetical protein
MTRSILAVIAVGVAVGVLSGTGCSQTGVGDPCTPEQEYNPQFNGFSEKEVNVESKSFQCQTRLCLVNHFRGRVSCPYGQDQSGNPPSGAKGACNVPGSATTITGNPADQRTGATVSPECLDRTADKAVYCSCRCANIDNKTDDGAIYCKCPDGFHCAQLVSSIGAGDTGLTGGYCVKDKTDYDPNAACQQSCDPKLSNCGKTQL